MIDSHSARRVVSAAFIVGIVACHSSKPSTAIGPTPSGTPTGKAAAAPNALPPGVTADMVTAGDAIFNGKSCHNCHGMGGTGGPRGPNLADDTWIHIDGSYDQIVSLVTTGFTKAEQRDATYPFSMNPRGGTQLTDDQIRQVSAYVWSLSHFK